MLAQRGGTGEVEKYWRTRLRKELRGGRVKDERYYDTVEGWEGKVWEERTGEEEREWIGDVLSSSKQRSRVF